MKVVLVSPYDMSVPGGVQAHVAQLARHLRERGDDVLVVGPSRGSAPAGSDGDLRVVGGSVGVPFNDSIAPVTLSPMAARRGLATIRRARPDVVHVHEPVAPLLSVAVTARAPRPLVGTFHAWSDRDRAYRLLRPVARRIVRRLDACIGVSGPAIDYHANALGLAAGAFREIPNGIDVARFASASPDPGIAAGEGPLVLFVGRLERRKGVEQLVRAFVRLKSRRPDVRLAVAGEGPEGPRCRDLIPPVLRDDVRFLGRVDPGDLPSVYAAADLFVAPALGGESFGIVLVEAMAAGLPVVATSIPGYRSVIRDGVDGRLVPPRDVDRLADAVGALLDNASLRAALAEEGRRRAARYDWETVAESVRETYDAVRRKPHGDPPRHRPQTRGDS